MNWKCVVVGHDWEIVSEACRVCLRCERHEVCVSDGGGWGVFISFESLNKIQKDRILRKQRADKILHKITTDREDAGR